MPESLELSPNLDKVIVLKTTDSTNLEARRERHKYAGSNVLFLAEEQTAGRGRGNHHWESHSGLGLWMSIFLGRLEHLDHDFQRISLLAGLVLHQIIAPLVTLRPRLKWPNDVMLDNKKCAGILTELQWSGSKLQSAIIGLGINLHHAPADFGPNIRDAAISLQLAGWEQPDHEFLLDRIIENFFEHLKLLDQAETLTDQWNERAYKRDGKVYWRTGHQLKNGYFRGISSEGSALIQIGSQLYSLTSGTLSFTSAKPSRLSL